MQYPCKEILGVGIFYVARPVVIVSLADNQDASSPNIISLNINNF